MKKTGLIMTLVVVFVLMSSLMAYAANPPYEVDIEALQGGTGTGNIHIFSPAGYSDYILQMGNIGDYMSLGVIDLSKYDTVTIMYGADGGAEFYDDEKHAWLALTTNGPTINSSYTPIPDVDIISQVNLENPDGNWAGGNTEVTMTIDSDFNGEVFLAMTMAKIGTRQDGIAITDIIFSDSTYTTPTPEPTKTPSPTPEKTATAVPTATKSPDAGDEGNGSIIPVVAAGAAVVVIAVVVVVIIVKKKKK